MQTERVIFSRSGLASRFMLEVSDGMLEVEPSLLSGALKKRADALVAPLRVCDPGVMASIVGDIATIVSALSMKDAVPILDAVETALPGGAVRVMGASAVLRHRLQHIVRAADISFTINGDTVSRMAQSAAQAHTN